MIDVQRKMVHGEAVTLAPPKKTIQAEADKTVGIRMNITPEVATEWLETRGNNRKVMQSTVDLYAADMRAGRWKFNGAPIQFDEDGKLLNGQHRLWAVIESGRAIDAIVQWGIPRESQATIDAGARWMSKDLLFMAGEKNCSTLQAALGWMSREEGGSLMSKDKISNSSSMELLERHPNLRRSVDFIAGHRSALPGGLASYLHYRISAIGQEKADEFFLRLQDGANLAADSPIYRLRERLLRSVTTKEKLSPTDAAALTIIAWNAYYANRPLQSLTWRKSGPAAQLFPTIQGLGGVPKARRKLAA